MPAVNLLAEAPSAPPVPFFKNPANIIIIVCVALAIFILLTVSVIRMVTKIKDAWMAKKEENKVCDIEDQSFDFYAPAGLTKPVPSYQLKRDKGEKEVFRPIVLPNVAPASSKEYGPNPVEMMLQIPAPDKTRPSFAMPTPRPVGLSPPVPVVAPASPRPQPGDGQVILPFSSLPSVPEGIQDLDFDAICEALDKGVSFQHLIPQPKSVVVVPPPVQDAPQVAPPLVQAIFSTAAPPRPSRQNVPFIDFSFLDDIDVDYAIITHKREKHERAPAKRAAFVPGDKENFGPGRF